jgi:(1->4)-alpha-D-glucan 1-alpha-D-glucosylmutase
VNDYLSINPELGGEDGFNQLSDELSAAGMGIVLDIVPNHMGISGPLNHWWQDVLENGETSAYAPFFDIQWGADRGARRVLVPMLPDQYGTVLEQGELSLVYTDAFFLKYGETLLPIAPSSYGTILGPVLNAPQLKPENRAEIEKLWAEYTALPTSPAADDPQAARFRRESVTRLKRRFALWYDSQPDLQVALATRLRQINGVKGTAESFNELDAIIAQQNYRVARWKTGRTRSTIAGSSRSTLWSAFMRRIRRSSTSVTAS